MSPPDFVRLLPWKRRQGERSVRRCLFRARLAWPWLGVGTPRAARAGAERRRGTGHVLGALAPVLFAPAAFATDAPTTAAQSAFDEGRYLEAAELAESLGTSDGHALAAEALAVYGHFLAPEDEKVPVLERANQLAGQAVALDETNAEARFQLAHAMGRYAQSIGPTKAVRQGYVGRSREAIEAVLELDPDMAEAHLSLASWNADVVAGVGRLLGRTVYGATVSAAIENYERTLELSPGEKVAYYEFGRGLLAIGGRKNRDRARSLLSRAVELPAGNHFDGLIHARALAELATLDGR